jgi:hypothetical protein
MTVRWVALEPGAEVIGLRYGYSPEKYQSAQFATAEEAAEFAAGDSFIEIPTLRNPGGAIITFEGRIIADPAETMVVGTAVERVWYTVPPDETPYDDFTAARAQLAQMAHPPKYVLEQLRCVRPRAASSSRRGGSSTSIRRGRRSAAATPTPTPNPAGAEADVDPQARSATDGTGAAASNRGCRSR